MYIEIMNQIIDACNGNIKPQEGDYIGDDGLLYCGKCGTRKQTEITVMGEVKRPMCLCKCAAERREQEKQERERREFAEKVKRYRRMGFPESDMHSWTFANDDGTNQRITAAMQRYVDNFSDMLKNGKGLLLHGDVGTGKTFAACEVANALIDKGYPALVTNFNRVINTVQSSFEKRQEHLDSLNDFPLLVLDDLGVERGSEYMLEMIYTIIDSRYRAGKPMIITTNIPIEEIKAPKNTAYSRIYDRILERCFPVAVTGRNRRKQMCRDSIDSMRELLGL